MLRRLGQARAYDGDRDQRHQVVRIGEVFPHWLVMWGAYSREFWAYPRFDVPRGTIVHSADPGELASGMRRLQTAVMGPLR